MGGGKEEGGWGVVGIIIHYFLLDLYNMAFLVLNREVLWDLSTP